jgi:muconolactone delta-isomerase
LFCAAHGLKGYQWLLLKLPLDAWMTVEITPLTPHPSDPGLAAS